jgi:hypothetical protein
MSGKSIFKQTTLFQSPLSSPPGLQNTSVCKQPFKSGKRKGEQCGGKISEQSITKLYCKKHLKEETKKKTKKQTVKEITNWAKNIIQRVNGEQSIYGVVKMGTYYIYPQLMFIIEPVTNKVVGRLYNNSVRELLKTDVELCKMYNFEYNIPSNMNTSDYDEQPIVDDLEGLDLTVKYDTSNKKIITKVRSVKKTTQKKIVSDKKDVVEQKVVAIVKKTTQKKIVGDKKDVDQPVTTVKTIQKKIVGDKKDVDQKVVATVKTIQKKIVGDKKDVDQKVVATVKKTIQKKIVGDKKDVDQKVVATVKKTTQKNIVSDKKDVYQDNHKLPFAINTQMLQNMNKEKFIDYDIIYEDDKVDNDSKKIKTNKQFKPLTKKKKLVKVDDDDDDIKNYKVDYINHDHDDDDNSEFNCDSDTDDKFTSGVILNNDDDDDDDDDKEEEEDDEDNIKTPKKQTNNYVKGKERYEECDEDYGDYDEGDEGDEGDEEGDDDEGDDDEGYDDEDEEECVKKVISTV